jgi:hypothetical protein
MLRIGLFALAALAAACSTPEGATAAAGGRDCFRTSQVSGFNVIDRNNIEVRVSPSRRYVLTTNWPTRNLNFSQAVAIRTATGFVCVGDSVGVELVGGDPVQTYPIQSVARSPEPPPAS